jgi:putative tricarboxylic transport membrane protein
MHRNSEFWGGLAWLAFGVAVTVAGWQLRLGAPTDPGSGFAIFWIGLITCALSAVVLGQAIVRGGPSLVSLWAGTRWPKILLVVSLLLVFGAFFETIGFVPSALALLLVLMRLVDPVRWLIALPVAFGAAIGVWAVLGTWLKIRLPAGFLEGFLG